MKKAYLGDGVYVEYDGFHLVLTTEDGAHVTNSSSKRICMEPQVIQAFHDYTKALAEHIRQSVTGG